MKLLKLGVDLKTCLTVSFVVFCWQKEV